MCQSEIEYPWGSSNDWEAQYQKCKDSLSSLLKLYISNQILTITKKKPPQNTVYLTKKATKEKETQDKRQIQETIEEKPRRQRIMFVPLPVPLVFQRTAPDFSAWRLKSPLPLRSGNSGKRYLYFPLVNVDNSFSFFPHYWEEWKGGKKTKCGVETPVQTQTTVWMKSIFLYFLENLLF